MKKTIAIFAISLLILSCGNNSHKEAEAAQKAAMEAQQRQLDSMKIEIARQHIIDSMNAVAEAKKQKPRERVIVTHSTHEVTTAANAPDNTGTKKKGWSAKAKGAVIGAGAGAVTGALIDKRKGEGAIVGGLAGAAIGLGTGAIIDDAQKKKEAQQKAQQKK